MTVHELAKHAGIPAHVVRYYTQRGLLKPRRNARNGYRQYAASDLYRLQFICRAKLVGFTLGDITLILRDADQGISPCAEVRQVVRLRSRQNEERIAAARRLQQRILDAMELWETLPDGNPDHESLCRLIDAIALEENATASADKVDDDENL